MLVSPPSLGSLQRARLVAYAFLLLSARGCSPSFHLHAATRPTASRSRSRGLPRQLCGSSSSGQSFLVMFYAVQATSQANHACMHMRLAGIASGPTGPSPRILVTIQIPPSFDLDRIDRSEDFAWRGYRLATPRHQHELQAAGTVQRGRLLPWLPPLSKSMTRNLILHSYTFEISHTPGHTHLDAQGRVDGVGANPAREHVPPCEIGIFSSTLTVPSFPIRPKVSEGPAVCYFLAHHHILRCDVYLGNAHFATRSLRVRSSGPNEWSSHEKSFEGGEIRRIPRLLR